MLFFIIVIAAVVCLLIAGRKISCIEKKGILKYFYQSGYWIHEKVEKLSEKKRFQILVKNFGNKKNLSKNIKTLYPADRNREHEKLFYAEKIAIVLMILLVGSVFGMLITIQMNDQSIFQNNRLKRGRYGEDSKKINLMAQVENQEPVEIEVEVSDQKYTKKEAIELLKEASKDLETIILGNNESADEVRENLNFSSTLKDGLISVEYELDNYDYVEPDGKLTDEIPKQGGLVQVTAKLSYDEHEYTSVFCLRILPEILTENEKMLSDLKEEMEQKNIESQYGEWQLLPLKLKGKKISWLKSMDYSGWIFFVICLIASIFIYCGKDADLNKEIEERQKQMMRDYPEVVNKLTLFLQAGMTVSGAWGKIVHDYEKRKEKDQKQRRYVYEEMLYTYREMQDGIAEAEAYLRFGKRCRGQKYMKFATLLVQNLRKGSNMLASILEYEAQDAFEERKNMAKRAGEEASTKLLLPMFLMLAIVIVIMIVPAFLSFGMG